MIDQENRPCRRCRKVTLHNRYRWEGLWIVQMFFILGSCWVCIPVTMIAALMIGIIDRVRPYHCVECKALNWRRAKVPAKPT